MRKRRRSLSFVSLALAITLLLATSPVRASPGITLERSEEWEEEGDTFVYAIFAEDVDGDDTVEILTGGKAYTGIRTEAQLRIWSWSGSVLTLEKTHVWNLGGIETAVLSIYAGDVDNDDTVEIVTAGYGYVNNAFSCNLVIWNWNEGYSQLTKEAELSQSVPSIFNSVYVEQLDGSGLPEIILAGVDLGSPDEATLEVWTFDGRTLDFNDRESWSNGDYDANATAVYARDVDSDVDIDIMTAGYFDTAIMGRHAELRVWHYSDSQLYQEDDHYWTGEGQAEALSVYAEDIDSDSTTEIITCGNTIDPIDGTMGFLKTFTHDGSDISEDRYEPWQDGTHTECRSVYAKQVNAAGHIDIITVGMATISGTDNGQITVWNPSVSGFDEQDTDVTWYTTDDTAANAVFAMDVDPDDDVEMLTGGQAYDTHDMKAQLRIWYWEI